MFHDFDDILTIDELAELLKIGKNTAYRLINTGQIKSIRIGRTHRIPKKSVIEYIISKNR
ncbi:helix-turn-helix domain-containing protein [Sporosarcina sp. FSL K6-5500]|uniref:helix-turn-helix domain-containing protein n=1 Tax=Sporosarcina sp. FSL K6-5500 TaxID=2921558 RepID=UPI0030FC655C